MSTSKPASQSRNWLLKILYTILIVVLAGTSFVKLYFPPKTGLTSFEFSTNFITAIWGVVLAFWLISDANRRMCLAVIGSTFAVYVFVNIVHLIRQVPDCGCFGRVSVDPAYTAILDTFVVGICTYCWNSARNSPEDITDRNRFLQKNFSCRYIVSGFACRCGLFVVV